MVEKNKEDEEENEDESVDTTALLGKAHIFGIPRLFVIIGAAIILLLLFGGGAAYFLGFFDSNPAIEGEQESAPEEHAPPEHKEAKGGHGAPSVGGSDIFVTIPPMNVNLQNEGGPSRFLRLSVVLELESASDKPAVESAMPRVIDEFQTYLRELRIEDLRGSAGRYRLEVEMLWRVNQAAAPAKIKDVLFQEMLIN